MDDVIVLIEQTGFYTDAAGNRIPSIKEREVLCQTSSAGRSEFYQAAQAGMHPEYIFTLSNFKDYRGEKLIRYTDWMGVTRVLHITRAYKIPDSDAIELTCEDRAGKALLEAESESGEES